MTATDRRRRRVLVYSGLMIVCGVAFQFMPIGWPLAALGAVFGVIGTAGAVEARRLLLDVTEDTDQ